MSEDEMTEHDAKGFPTMTAEHPQFFEPEDSEDFDLDEEFAPQPRHKLGRLTGVLAVLLIVGLGILGGVALQKHYGSSSSATSAFARAGAAGGARAGGEGGAGFAAGGFGGA